MVRAPCCEKMGLKRGPWTAEEDTILIAFIQKYGHGNWRALPKQAGLLRCGKSCRLRWTNYLRPDIKRGNFSNEEEETIIKLHELLGNRWSTIAARLPGRTDNEIKNVWHTHLKKRLDKNGTAKVTKRKSAKRGSKREIVNLSESDDHPQNCSPPSIIEVSSNSTGSPQQSSSEFSSGTESSSVVTTVVDNHDMGVNNYNESAGTNTEHDVPFSDSIHIGEDFWTDESLYGNLNILEDLPPSTGTDPQDQTSFSSDCSIVDDGMDFWFDLFMKAEDEPVLAAEL